MDSGKSPLALQTNHNHAARGRVGRIFTAHDRAGSATVSSRLGLPHDAIEGDPPFAFWAPPPPPRRDRGPPLLRLLAPYRRRADPRRAGGLLHLRRGAVLLRRAGRGAG